MSIHDRHLTFSIDQQVTTATNVRSTDQYDSAPLFGANTGVDLGTGETLDLVVICTETMDDAGDDTTITVTLESDSTATSETAAVVHLTLPVFAANSAAGTFRRATLPPGQTWKEFVFVRYTATGGALDSDGGQFTAFICPKAAVPNTAAKYASALNFA